jgi:cation:H+ antiporter
VSAVDVVIGVFLSAASGILIEELVDYLSWRYSRSTAGVAAIVAPIITSSPELAVFLIALAEGQAKIAWGTIVSQPFMASTVIYPLIVLAALSAWLLGKRKFAVPHVHRIVAVPLLAFTIPLLPILALRPERYGVAGRLYGAALLAAYFAYALFMLRGRASAAERRRLSLRSPVVQALAAVAAIYFGAESLVKGIESLGALFGLDELALSVVLVPIATALPESIVGLIFIFKGRDDEGVGAVIGEKALYSTFYPGLAMALGVYSLEPAAAVALIIAVVISLFEIAAIWFGYFGFTAPIGLAGYIWYLIHVLHL